ncbi:MAG TPA: hypothetical protein PKM65_17515 [Spirochaetota bacterium]|nr:hypothetical protein [Spirochaetota bacterium]HNT11308.1 hypothetical protein [Spirochaetota bacterium]
MKVIHALKRIETIDQDIRDLKKLEKTIKTNKSFSTPIYMSIEKQINILLGERIKLLELKIANPPAMYLEEDAAAEPAPVREPERPAPKPAVEKKAKPKKPRKKEKPPVDDEEDMEEISMLTQSLIDEKIEKLQSERAGEAAPTPIAAESPRTDDESVKLLDIALEKGTLGGQPADKEKKKVRFFRNNFPGGEY